jgi:hypothetical protein
MRGVEKMANISFGTPGSDYISKIFSLIPASNLIPDREEFQFIFARAGNDIINIYDPTTENPETPNIDVLVGDLFDNSPQEFGVFSSIQNGNLFAILDADISSVGADRFVLGNESQSYYTNPDAAALTKTDPFGFKQFAIVYDFDPGQDVIQLHGTDANYVLAKFDPKNNPLLIPGLEGFSGEAIYSLETGQPDLVALVVSNPREPGDELDLQADYFQYVDETLQDQPKKNKIKYFGTPGQDQGFGVAIEPGSGHFYVMGMTTGSLNGPNQGSTDVWLSKYNSKDNALGKRTLQLGSSAADHAFNVVTCSGLQKRRARLAKSSIFGSDYLQKLGASGSQSLQMGSHYSAKGLQKPLPAHINGKKAALD